MSSVGNMLIFIPMLYTRIEAAFPSIF